MKTFLLLIFCVISTTVSLYAQDAYSNDPEQSFVTQRLNISCDSRLGAMLAQHIENNNDKNGMDGYRVEIFFSSAINAKEEATNIKTIFLRNHPEYAAHIMFVSPNFRVRVGDFRTKSEALKVYKLIQNTYPSSFIVPDVIDFPLLKPDKL